MVSTLITVFANVPPTAPPMFWSANQSTFEAPAGEGVPYKEKSATPSNNWNWTRTYAEFPDRHKPIHISLFHSGAEIKLGSETSPVDGRVRNKVVVAEHNRRKLHHRLCNAGQS